jgi:hypothetical protein
MNQAGRALRLPSDGLIFGMQASHESGQFLEDNKAGGDASSKRRSLRLRKIILKNSFYLLGNNGRVP